MDDHQQRETASRFSKDAVNQTLLSILLTMATEKDKDQTASINVLIDSITSSIAKTVGEQVEKGDIPNDLGELLISESAEYANEIKSGALGVAKVVKG